MFTKIHVGDLASEKCILKSNSNHGCKNQASIVFTADIAFKKREYELDENLDNYSRIYSIFDVFRIVASYIFDHLLRF
jgi:hypothetical protein